MDYTKPPQLERSESCGPVPVSVGELRAIDQSGTGTKN